jgi:membrane protein DedA with SNARE-associated domain
METQIFNHIGSFSYLTIVLLLFAASFGFPFPKNLTLLAGGAMAGVGSLNLFLVMLWAVVGTVLGDASLCALGWRYGERVYKFRLFSKIYSEKRLSRLKTFFENHGSRAVFWARFTPIARSGIYVLAGVTRMKPATFLAFDLLSALALCPLICYLGFVFYREFDVLRENIKLVESVLGMAIIAAAGVTVLIYLRRKRKEIPAENREGLS